MSFQRGELEAAEAARTASDAAAVGSGALHRSGCGEGGARYARVADQGRAGRRYDSAERGGGEDEGRADQQDCARRLTVKLVTTPQLQPRGGGRIVSVVGHDLPVATVGSVPGLGKCTCRRPVAPRHARGDRSRRIQPDDGRVESLLSPGVVTPLRVGALRDGGRPDAARLRNRGRPDSRQGRGDWSASWSRTSPRAHGGRPRRARRPVAEFHDAAPEFKFGATDARVALRRGRLQRLPALAGRCAATEARGPYPVHARRAAAHRRSVQGD